MSAPLARGQRGGPPSRGGRGAVSSARGRGNNRALLNNSTRGRSRGGREPRSVTRSSRGDGLLQKLRAGTVQRTSDDGARNEGRGRGTARGASVQSSQGRGRGNLTRVFNNATTPVPKSQTSTTGPTSYRDFMNDMTAKFQSLKQTREAERSRAIRDGFLADPEKKTSLDKAITPVGTCTEMCPQFERVERIVQNMVDKAEKTRDASSGRENPAEERMVKRFRRSAAGYDEQLPSDIRTPQTLKRTLDYLLDKIIGGPERLASIHKFVWDRTRGIRNDFSIQQVTKQEDVKIAVDCYERIARFHILSLHQLANPDNLLEGENFDSHQEREQLNNTLLSLIYYYDDHRHAISFPNEGEFRAYCIILEIQSQHPDLEDRMQSWPAQLLDDKKVNVAFKLHSAASNTLSDQGPLRPFIPFSIAQANGAVFWNLLSSKAVPYLVACVAEIYFSQIRFTALDAIWRSGKSAPTAQQARSRDWSLPDLTQFLGFDTEEQTMTFCAAFDLSFNSDESGEQYLNLTALKAPSLDKTSIPNQQIFSHHYVEEKRYRRSLVAVINGIPVSHAIRQGLIDADEEIDEDNEGTNEDDQSIFIPEKVPELNPTPASQLGPTWSLGSSLNPQARTFTSNFGESSTPKPAEAPKLDWSIESTNRDNNVPTVNNMFSKTSKPQTIAQQEPAQQGQEQAPLIWNTTGFNKTSATTLINQPAQGQSPFQGFNFATSQPQTSSTTNTDFGGFKFAQPSVSSAPPRPSSTPGVPFFNNLKATSTPMINNIATNTSQPFKSPFTSVTAAAPSSTPFFSPPKASSNQDQATIPTSQFNPLKEANIVNQTKDPFPSSSSPKQVEDQNPVFPTRKPVFVFGPLPGSNERASETLNSRQPSKPLDELKKFEPQPKKTSAVTGALQSHLEIGFPQSSSPKPQVAFSITSSAIDLQPSTTNEAKTQSVTTEKPLAGTQHPGSPTKLVEKPAFSENDRARLIDTLAKLSLLQPRGLMQEFLEFRLPDILHSVEKKYRKEVFAAKTASIRSRILARKFGNIWREKAWRNNLSRRAKNRRQLFAETIRAEQDKKKRGEDELNSILEAMEEKKRIQQEQSKELDRAKFARVQDNVLTNENEEGQATGKKRKDTSEHQTSTMERSNQPGQLYRHHKRSRTIGSANDGQRVMNNRQSPSVNQRFSISNTLSSLANSGNLSVLRPSSSQGSRPIPSRQKVDHTLTDYFRLKALGIDPDSPIIPHTKDSLIRQKRRQEEEKRSFLERSMRRPSSMPAPPQPAQLQKSESPVQSRAEAAGPQISKISSQVYAEDAFLRKLRETREAMAADEKWFKAQSEALEKQITEEEEDVFRRSLDGSHSTLHTSVNGMAKINGYEYRPADLKPGQSISRTERRIRETGAHGLATKPVGVGQNSIGVPMSKKTASLYDPRKPEQKSRSIATTTTAKKKRHRNLDPTYRPVSDEEDYDEEEQNKSTPINPSKKQTQVHLKPNPQTTTAPSSSSSSSSSRPTSSSSTSKPNNRFGAFQATTENEDDDEADTESNEAEDYYQSQAQAGEYYDDDDDQDEDDDASDEVSSAEEEEEEEEDDDTNHIPSHPHQHENGGYEFGYFEEDGVEGDDTHHFLPSVVEHSRGPSTEMSRNSSAGPGACVDDALVLSD